MAKKILKLNNIPNAKLIQNRQKIKIPLEWLSEEYFVNQTKNLLPKQKSSKTKEKQKRKE